MASDNYNDTHAGFDTAKTRLDNTIESVQGSVNDHYQQHRTACMAESRIYCTNHEGMTNPPFKVTGIDGLK